MHGDSIKNAVIDFRFKEANRDKSYYENMTINSELSYEDAIICYRVITGACSFGVQDFIKNRLKETKEKYTVGEIISLVNGEYGATVFGDFFGVSASAR